MIGAIHAQIIMHLWENPFSLYCLAAGISTGDIEWYVGSIVAIVTGMAMSTVSGYRRTILDGRSVLSEILDSSSTNQSLYQVSTKQLNSVLPSEAQEILRPFAVTFAIQRLRQISGMPERALQRVRVYVRSFYGPPFDGKLKAYTSYVGTSFIFLLDQPHESDSAYNRFKLYHELNHVSYHAVTEYGFKERRLILPLFATLFVPFYSNVIWWFNFFTIFYLIASFMSWLSFKIEFEMKADLFALHALDSRTEAAEAVRLAEKAWSYEKDPANIFEFKYRVKCMKLFLARGTGPYHAPKSNRGIYYISCILFFGYAGLMTSSALSPSILVFMAAFVIVQFWIAGRLHVHAALIQRKLEERIDAIERE